MLELIIAAIAYKCLLWREFAAVYAKNRVWEEEACTMSRQDKDDEGYLEYWLVNTLFACIWAGIKEIVEG